MIEFMSNLLNNATSLGMKRLFISSTNSMKILSTILLLITTAAISYSQQTVCLGTDATVCVGSSITIQDCNPGTGTGTIVANPTYVNLSDDSWSTPVNMGFTFNFYGNDFTQCTIGSNGVISFNMGNAGGYCPWSLGAVGSLPTTGFAAAFNSMMPAYHDINPAASPNGSIYYETIGVAPNRRFIVVYKNLANFGPAGFCADMAVIVNETSNSFEYHIGFKSMSPTWNGGLAIQGSENATGTIAHITPGRNNTQWTATQEAKIWTPTAPSNTSNYTISPIPYEVIVNSGGTGTLVWANTLNTTTWPYNGGDLVINPVLPGTTGYFLASSLPATCSNNPVTSSSDTTFITGISSGVSASMTDDICSAGQGTVTATPTLGIPPFVYNWPGLGNNPNQTVTGVFAGTYTVEMWDGNGCMSIANVTVGDTPAAFQGTTTIISCPGGNDGTAFAEMVPVLGNVTYLWDDPAAQTTQTAVGLTAGQYTCTITSDIGCAGTVVLDVTEIPGMIGNIVNQSNVTCNSSNNGMIEVNVTQGTAPYTYSWDNSTSTTNIADDLFVGPHTVTVTDFNGCVITIDGVLTEPASLDITFLTPDTQICPEDDITLIAIGAGGSSPYTFTWFENGTQIGTGDQLVVDPELTNTQYCVELSEACGSPVDNKCNNIYFPTRISPNSIPDEYEKCVPGFFEFTNTSTNGGEIATTYWHFGIDDYYGINNLVMLENGNDSISMNFNGIGTYDAIMVTTSIYGCVYTDTIESIMEVKPTPVADFFFSTNPATIFETTVFMQDKSSSDVVSWNWDSPGSSPSTTNTISPVLVFPEGEVNQYPVTLAVETERGCVDTTTIYFHVIQDILFFAPNTFTPDGDEFNQLWKPEITGIDIYDYDMFIFNRWGELIWESHNPSVGWDGTYNGKKVPIGTYVWRARVSNPYDDAKQEFNGSINVLR